MLTIFDCDGVLIDSEIISATVTSEILNDEGIAMTAEEVTSRFAGLASGEMEAILSEETGLPVSGRIKERIQAEFDRRIVHVKAVPGVAELLDTLDGPRCVGSNADSAYLKRALTSAGLYDRFKPYVFSAGEVGTRKGKPDPNVFLHAAQELGVAPSDTIVIEDSFAGVSAAVRAGMRAIGFTGGAHSWPGHADALMEAGAETVVRRHSDILAVIEAFGNWDGRGV